MVSLKRTLLSDLASSIDVINPINQESSKSNLHTPLRYSAVLLSIGKTTHICHQNIPLKKVHCKETVTYVSAISRKLGKIWQQPMGDIASNLLRVLLDQATPSVWSSISQNEAGWLEFVISQRGMDQWRQQLTPQMLPTVDPILPPPSITPEQLWQLQSGYELCCRWQACYQQINSQQINSQQISGVEQVPSEISPGVMFSMPHPPLYQLIHCLLDICDGWDGATVPQLLQMSQQLIRALAQCTAATTPISPAAAKVSRWLGPTQVVLKQLLGKKFGYQLGEWF